MPLQLVVANPPRRKARRKKAAKKATRRRRTTRRPATMARKKTTRRRRRSVSRAAPARRRRRRSSRASFGGSSKTFVMDAAKAGVGGTAGYIAAELLPDRFQVAQLQTGYGRVAAKAIIGVVGGLMLGKFVGRRHGAAFAAGAMTSAGVSLYQQFRPGSLSGLGQIGMSLPPLLDYSNPAADMAGVGEFVDTTAAGY